MKVSEMPKIKGWKKIGTNTWENEQSGMVLRVEDFYDISKNKVSGHFASLGASEHSPATEFDDINQGGIWKHKGSLVKETIEFMRNNPNFSM